MNDIIKNYSDGIRIFLESYLNEKAEANSSANKWGNDVFERVKNFSSNGKMIRGSLVLFTEDMYSRKNDTESVKLAAAIELFHSGLLIHDDIIDRDEFRRGEPSLHYQYKKAGSDECMEESGHFGISMGICAGDIVFFTGFSLLSSLNVGHEFKNKILKLFGNEFTTVGLGQMQDIYFGASDYRPEEDDILKLYLYKTARYTFSLPFMLGGLLAGINDKELGYLEKLGEFVGLIFQIKDDELGIFGEQAQSGKRPGSDIEGEKKTLFHLYLFKNASQEERDNLSRIFGSSDISKESLKYTRDLINKYKIRSLIEKKYEEYKIKSLEVISVMNISSIYKDKLRELLEFNLTRTK